ncbi:hypothetical protein [Anaerosporobacter sp.]
MTEKEVIQYNAIVARVERNGSKILELQFKEIPVVSGKVKGSSPHFPYIETHIQVQMNEPKEEDKLNKRIAVLQKLVDEDSRKIEEIDKLYADITDNELKTIFDMRVYEGKTWYDIAAELGEDKTRTTYSRKLKKYLENAHNARIAQISGI